MSPKGRKPRMVQISTRLPKNTLIKLDSIVEHTNLTGEYTDRNKITRKLIQDFVNSKENQALDKRFKKSHSAKYKEIKDQIQQKGE